MSVPLVTVLTPTRGARDLAPVYECLQRQSFKDWHHVVIFDNVVAFHNLRFEHPQVSFQLAPKSNWIDQTAWKLSQVQVSTPYVAYLMDDDRWSQNHLLFHLAELLQRADSSYSAVRFYRRGQYGFTATGRPFQKGNVDINGLVHSSKYLHLWRDSHDKSADWGLMNLLQPTVLNVATAEHHDGWYLKAFAG